MQEKDVIFSSRRNPQLFLREKCSLAFFCARSFVSSAVWRSGDPTVTKFASQYLPKISKFQSQFIIFLCGETEWNDQTWPVAGPRIWSNSRRRCRAHGTFSLFQTCFKHFHPNFFWCVVSTFLIRSFAAFNGTVGHPLRSAVNVRFQ